MRQRVRRPREAGEIRSACIGGVLCVALAVAFALAAVIAYRHFGTVLFPAVLAAIAVFEAAMGASSFRRSARFREEVRRREGCCPHCGYDLRASPEKGGALLGRCPECGAIPKQA